MVTFVTMRTQHIGVGTNWRTYMMKRGRHMCTASTKRLCFADALRYVSQCASHSKASPCETSEQRDLVTVRTFRQACLPPVGVQSTAEQLLHTTTVCEWLKTVVLHMQPSASAVVPPLSVPNFDVHGIIIRVTHSNREARQLSEDGRPGQKMQPCHQAGTAG